MFHRGVSRIHFKLVVFGVESWLGAAGPRIQLSLPSFSGGTSEHPSLLSYACALHTNVRAVPGIRVRCPEPSDDGEAAGESLAGLFKGRPLLTLHFDDMAMLVRVSQH